MSGATIRSSDLCEAILQGANLRAAQLFDCDLSGADLRGANLRHADLRSANLAKVLLDGADLQYCVLPDGSIWSEKSDLSRFTHPEHSFNFLELLFTNKHVGRFEHSNRDSTRE